MSCDDDKYYYTRDHARGPGEWSVAGPGLNMPAPDKMLAFAIAKLLSGKTSVARDLAENYAKYVAGDAIPDTSWDAWAGVEPRPAKLTPQSDQRGSPESINPIPQSEQGERG